MNSEADYNCWYYNQNIRIAYIKLEDCPEWKAISLTLTYVSCWLKLKINYSLYKFITLKLIIKIFKQNLFYDFVLPLKI